jgi:hypothetical protein
MSEEWRTARLLAVILAAGRGGLLALMGADEEGTLDALRGHRRELTRSVVAAVDPSVRQAEIERVKRKRPDSLDASDLVLHVYPAMPEGVAKALPLLGRTLNEEPDHALAHGLPAISFLARTVVGGDAACQAALSLRRLS